MKKTFILLTIVFFSIAFQLQLKAQAGDYKFHTIYIYNFTKYIQWPASYQTGDFIIGVLGVSPITANLKTIATSKKTVGSQKLVIKQFNDINNIENCHVIFIPNPESRHLTKVREKLKGKSTLIITERNGLALQGSAINFVLRNGRWRFEINPSETSKAGLKVSNQLMRVAIPVLTNQEPATNAE